jgi:serine/threonine-protein phosphatase 6 regulatory ankyrin repeat subunit B
MDNTLFENLSTLFGRDDINGLLDYLRCKGVSIFDVRDSSGNTPLHYAVWKNSKRCLEYLLGDSSTSGAIDINAQDEDGNTPLHLAVSYYSKECLEILLNTIPSGGAIDVDAVNNEGDTPLHEAARNNSREFMKILVDCGASSGIRNNYGETFLDLIEDKEMEEYICQLTTLHLKEPGFF